MVWTNVINLRGLISQIGPITLRYLMGSITRAFAFDYASGVALEPGCSSAGWAELQYGDFKRCSKKSVKDPDLGKNTKKRIKPREQE
jgi:hypothetical protein